LLLLAAVVPLRAATLWGMILVNEMGGAPLANVSVAAEGANKTTTDDEGMFTLGFPMKHPGEQVRVVVNHAGHVVVNDVQLEVNLPETNSTFRLVLLVCKQGVREEMARRFYRLKSFEAIDASYQQQLQELKAKGEAKAAALAQLQRECNQAKAAAEKAADELARVTVGEASELYRQAMGLFVGGKVDEALRVLDDEKLRLAAEAAERQARQVVENYLLKARILTTQFRFDEAAAIYRRATNVVPNSFEACFSYGAFCQELNRYERCRPVYERALALARLSGNEDQVALTLNNLGILHRVQNRMAEAGKAYEEALQIYRSFAEKNPERYKGDVKRVEKLLKELKKEPASAK
jgi:tetratricopeptide (TPR) repeat protein